MSDNDTKHGATDQRELLKSKIRHPRPEEVFKAGITTKESLDWEEQIPPDVPAPHPTPDDSDGWATAARKAQQEHDQRVAEKRRAFRALGEDTKNRFRAAHDYKGEPKGYER